MILQTFDTGPFRGIIFLFYFGSRILIRPRASVAGV